MASPGAVRADAGGAEGPLVQGVPLVHHLPPRDAELAQQVQAVPATVNTSTAYTARYLPRYFRSGNRYLDNVILMEINCTYTQNPTRLGYINIHIQDFSIPACKMGEEIVLISFSIKSRNETF